MRSIVESSQASFLRSRFGLFGFPGLHNIVWDSDGCARLSLRHQSSDDPLQNIKADFQRNVHVRYNDFTFMTPSLQTWHSSLSFFMRRERERERSVLINEFQHHQEIIKWKKCMVFGLRIWSTVQYYAILLCTPIHSSCMRHSFTFLLPHAHCLVPLGTQSFFPIKGRAENRSLWEKTHQKANGTSSSTINFKNVRVYP